MLAFRPLHQPHGTVLPAKAALDRHFLILAAEEITFSMTLNALLDKPLRPERVMISTKNKKNTLKELKEFAKPGTLRLIPKRSMLKSNALTAQTSLFATPQLVQGRPCVGVRISL